MAKGRILAIDNGPDARDFFRTLLEKQGYEVTTAASGREGLERLYQEGFDVVILDMALKEENALEIADSIRHLNPDQELIVATNRNEVDLAVQAMRRGTFEYLLKPIDPEPFLLLLGKILFRQVLRSEHAKLLDENIDYFSMVASFRRCLELLKVSDVDRLSDHITDLMMELLRADGACLWTYREMARHFRLRSVRGLSRVQPDETVLSFSEAEKRKYLGEEPSFEADARAIVVPVPFGGEVIALLRLEEPSGRERFNRKDLKVAQMVAEFAACGLHNALLLRGVEQNALRAPRGESYSMAFFGSYTDKEISKSRRYHRNLSLLKLEVMNYQKPGGDAGGAGANEALGLMTTAVNTTLREGDILAMERPDEYFVLLPETDFWESLLTQRRILRLLRSTSLPAAGAFKDGIPRMRIRSATFPADGSSFDQLAAVAEKRLGQMAASLAVKGGIEEAPFWTAVEKIFLPEFHHRVEESPRKGFRESCFTLVTEETIEAIMRSFCLDLVESKREKSFIYRGCGKFPAALEAFPLVESLERSAASIFLLGETRKEDWFCQRIVPICIPDPAFSRYPFLFYLSEEYAYALITHCVKGEWIGFHTSDYCFVESMIFKLQEQYRLQESM